MVELVARPDLGHCQSDDHSTMDTVLYSLPDAARDVEEALLMAPTLGAHITGGGIRRLTERL